MNERDYEQEARDEGWVPQDEWRGDPNKWKEAKDFVEAGENILPIVKSKLERLEKTNAELAQHFQNFKQREEKEKATLRAELEKAKQQAITEGDGEAFMRAEKELQDIQPEQTLTPIQSGWLQDNNWYGKDENLTIFADGISDKLIREGYTDQSPAYFDELTRRVKGFSPDTFGNPKRDKASAVETTTEKGNTSKEKSYESLPADAKRACDDFVKQGFMSAEDYVKTYDWETADV